MVDNMDFSENSEYKQQFLNNMDNLNKLTNENNID